MMQQGLWRQFGVVALGVLSLAAGQGCLSCVHSLDSPPKDQVVLGESIPAPCRSHVHIFLIHGLDPLELANLSGLTEYLHQLGYLKTHYGQCYHMWEFKKEMRRLHKEEPKTRFVVIGFSFGSLMARELVNAVKKDDIPVDLLIYLGGFILDNTPRTQPENAGHIANVLTEGCILKVSDMDRADNIRCPKVWHFGLPTHQRTRELLARELAAVALRVPYVQKEQPLSPELEEEIPRPRRVPPNPQRQQTPLSSEWSFLNSRSAAGEPPPPALAKPDDKRNVRRLPYSVMP